MDAREYGDQLLRQLLENVVATVPGVIGAGLSLSRRDELTSIAAVGAATVMDPLQLTVQDGPLLHAVEIGAAVVCEVRDDGRWPKLTAELADMTDRAGLTGLVGAVCVPGAWGEVDPVLFSVYLDRAATAQILAEIDSHEALLSQSLAVVEFCVGEGMRADQMLKMAQSRRIIEQAKGLVIAAQGCDAEQAFAALTRASQHFNIRLKTLAAALVQHVGRGPIESVPHLPRAERSPSEADLELAARIWTALRSDKGGP